ncbi:MAG: hypothetical protein AAF988_02225 [Pseudomonadota bacterium]
METHLDEEVYAEENELVFEKAKQCAFRKANCLLTHHFRYSGQDTLIMDGIKAYHCLADSIGQAIEKPHKFRVFIPLNASNVELENRHKFIDWFMRGTPNHLKSCVTFTDTDKIVRALRQAQANRNAALTAKVG